MKTSEILECISRVLFPFILLYGFYIIINGHLTPGGGFQGGAILATAVLISYFIYPDKIRDLNLLIKLEKYVFIIILLFASASLLTKGEIFTSFLPIDTNVNLKSVFLVNLNLFIGIKVSIGLILVFSTFIEEGK
ncbi:MnhB domain-containing protein [Caldisalinibacter kiritimatiensis]|uniref:Na+/H+ antiporter MnhB subunit-related protein n=1 Tax=Caldisalinibacter kiritimatiensis TaxID=1304284 RepID=R1AXE2_9FIRM|nr:MnhB domain-containing protein [Caldisalinibacter kiritimatiensis]EOD01868.1 Na+/H+ antiporter MnhB subunit-related protein [Caldisalinibacter kiritimatiensis]